ncbi:MAG: hypothetical protein ACREVZ_11770, partial [Burkholderiales bacterium]
MACLVGSRFAPTAHVAPAMRQPAAAASGRPVPPAPVRASTSPSVAAAPRDDGPSFATSVLGWG